MICRVFAAKLDAKPIELTLNLELSGGNDDQRLKGLSLDWERVSQRPDISYALRRQRSTLVLSDLVLEDFA